MGQERDRQADERDRVADQRDSLALAREQRADALENDLAARGVEVDEPRLRALADNSAQRTQHRAAGDARAEATRRATRSTAAAAGGTAVDAWHAERREFVADDRQERADAREAWADARERSADERDQGLAVASGIKRADTAEAAQRRRAEGARSTASAARAKADQARAAVTTLRPLTNAFSLISRALSSPARLDQGYAEVVAQAQRLIAGASWVSLTIREGTTIRTAASTQMIAAGLDQVQYASGQGPCLEAMDTNGVVVSDDLAADTQWPAFAAAAVAVAAGSVLCAPVPDPGGEPTATGAMNHYGTAPAAFDEEAAQIATLLTAHLAALLAVAASAAGQIEHLGQAVQARDVIGQAKGILMERHGLSAEQAFDRLRVASNNLNRKIRELAEDLAYTGRLPEAGPRGE
jgi:hypothetical protein